MITLEGQCFKTNPPINGSTPSLAKMKGGAIVELTYMFGHWGRWQGMLFQRYEPDLWLAGVEIVEAKKTQKAPS